MPIFEFKCLDCDKYVEILVLKKEETIEMTCPGCGSENLERILSATSYAMGPGAGEQKAATQTRTCSTGSCTTYDIPGHSR